LKSRTKSLKGIWKGKAISGGLWTVTIIYASFIVVLLTEFHGRRGGERQILDANPSVRASIVQREKGVHTDGVAAGRVRKGRQGVQWVCAAADDRKRACGGEHGGLELQSVWDLVAFVCAKGIEEILLGQKIQRLRELCLVNYSK